MKILHQPLLALNTLALLALLAPLSVLADEAHHQPAAASAAAAQDLTVGEIRKIDLESARITLKHGEIKNLDMPPMTMVFVVKDKALLDKLKAGDKVRFKAVNENGKFTVTDLVAVP